jgi:3-oxoacyl-[acyl-carrier-protein] synthase III
MGRKDVMPITIGPIGRSGGRQVSIEEVVWSSNVEREKITALKADGFTCFIQNDHSVPTMATEAIEDCLRQTHLPRRNIDAAIISTESLWDLELAVETAGEPDEHLRFRDSLLGVILRAGLVNAQPYGNWLSGCANSLATVDLARSLVSAGQHRCVLAVMTDRVRPEQSRIVRSEIGVYSDIAVACLVTELPLRCAGYRINQVVSHSQVSLLAGGSEGDWAPHVRELVKALGSFERKIKEKTGRRLGDYSAIIADNLSSEYFSFVCHCLSIDSQRISLPSKSEVGHAFSGDWMLSLRYLQQAGHQEQGQLIAILNFGFSVFSFAELEVDTDNDDMARA